MMMVRMFRGAQEIKNMIDVVPRIKLVFFLLFIFVMAVC